MAKSSHSKLLEHLIEQYSEINRITERVLSFDENEREKLLVKRGVLIEECNAGFQKLNNRQETDTDTDYSRKLDIQLRQQILSVIAMDELLYTQFEHEKEQMRRLLPTASDRNRAASYYGLNSRYSEF